MRIDLSTKRQIGIVEEIKKEKGKYLEVRYKLFRDKIPGLVKEVKDE